MRLRATAWCALAVACGAARADRASVDTELFRPPATSGGILDADAAFVAPHLSVAGALYFDYAHAPLVLRDATGRLRSDLVPDQLQAQLALSFALWRRLEIGALLPVLLFQDPNQEAAAAVLGSAPPIARGALGDLRLELKVEVARFDLSDAAQIALGLAVGVGVPTGDDNAFFGEGGVSFRPRALASLRTRLLELSINLGALVRASVRTIGDLGLGQQLAWGAGARLKLFRGLSVDASVGGLYNLSGGATGLAAAPTEGLVGPAWRFGSGVELAIAAGRGITSAYGAPDLRVVLAVRFQPRPPIDKDGDGIADGDDRCPDEAGPADLRGCPERDRDGDGILDRLDRCPDRPGPGANLGCPDPDRDGDGVVDRADKCPDEPGPRATAGCPDRDRDGDGILDGVDRCPDKPGPAATFGCPPPDRDGDAILDADDACPDLPGIVENRGCPDADRDGDGIVDRLDKCPDEREVFNGVDDDDGCPDQGRELAVLTPSRIAIREQVLFDTGRATIRRASFLLLATVAKILILHPEITRVRIEGHTDDVGKREKNLALSQARAEAVMAHLTGVNGIDAMRLSAVGFGPDKPIADNKHHGGRAKNRRVEFQIASGPEPM